MENQLTVRWSPDSTPSNITYEKLESGIWIPIGKPVIEYALQFGRVVYWNPKTK